MEEIINFLLDSNIDLILQEICENHRTKQYWKDSWSNKLLSSKKSLFSGSNLSKTTDPSHWTTSSGEKIQSMNSIIIPTDYLTCIDWKININHPISTDIEGWQYNKDFIVHGWSITPSYETEVRHRKWERLLVHKKDIKVAKTKVQEFTSYRREYRSFNPQLIHCALKQTDYQIQYILESQRLALPSSLNNTRTSSAASDNPTYYSESGRSSSTSRPSNFNYSELNLLSTDPSQWTIISPTLYPSNLIGSIDPTSLPSSHLVDAYSFLYSNPHGLNSLHEFIFTIYPNKDSMGWEYNIDFDQVENWSSSPQPTRFVRRRVWFRTLVPLNSLYQCRQLLTSYIQSHPRGLCYQGSLQRLSQYRKRWTQGIARIVDSTLSIDLENNYQKNYTFSLLNCEVQAIDGLSDLQKYSQSSSTSNNISNLPDWNELTTGNTRTNLFCLCSINSSGQYTGIQTIFNALTPYERIQWITILSHQITLHNISFWSLKYSPPLVDSVVYSGELFKLGHVVQNWKLRRFELTQKGILSYFKGEELKGKMRLRGCQIEWNQTTNGIRNEFKIKKLNGYELSLRGKSAYEMNQWMTEIRPFTGMDTDERVLFPSLILDHNHSLSHQSIGSGSAGGGSDRVTDPFIQYNETSLPSPPKLTPQPTVTARNHSISYLPVDRVVYVEQESQQQTQQHQDEQIHSSLMELFPEEEPPLESSQQQQPNNQSLTVSSTNYYEEEEMPITTTITHFNEENILQVEQITIIEMETSQNILPTHEEEQQKNEEEEKKEEEIVIVNEREEQDDDGDLINNTLQEEKEIVENINTHLPFNNNIETNTLQQQEQQELENEYVNDERNQERKESEDSDSSGLSSNSLPSYNPNTCNTNNINNINNSTTNTSQTHELIHDRQGRRVSLLNVNIVDTAQEQIIWGGNDSDESDENESSRLSSFSTDLISNPSPPLTLISKQSQSGSFLTIETTHEVIKDSSGRRVSVLNTNIVNSVEENIIWGGNDSDESDGESSSRTSSFSENWSHGGGESRPLSLRANTTTTTTSSHYYLSQQQQEQQEHSLLSPTETSETTTTTSEGGGGVESIPITHPSDSRTFSSYFGFGKNRRKSL